MYMYKLLIIYADIKTSLYRDALRLMISFCYISIEKFKAPFESWSFFQIFDIRHIYGLR